MLCIALAEFMLPCGSASFGCLFFLLKMYYPGDGTLCSNTTQVCKVVSSGGTAPIPNATIKPLLCFAQIELDDGFTFDEPLLGSSNAFLDILKIDDILSFSSSVPTAVQTMSLGDVVLLSNHHEIITLTAETKAGCTGPSAPITSIVQVHHTNLPSMAIVAKQQKKQLLFHC